MRINAPVASADEVEPLSQAGADELYCGVVELKNEKPAALHFYNRRPTPEGNLSSFRELQEVVKRAHQINLPVNLVLNEPYYLQEQFRVAIEHAFTAIDCGIDALIISDPFLFEELHRLKSKAKLYVSTTASVFNRATIDFFLQMGARRIILPRQLRLQEIKEFVDLYPGLEFEVIILGDPCPWDDGLCTYEHNLHHYTSSCGFRGGGCHLPYDITPVKLNASVEAEELVTGLRLFASLSGCGFCSLWDLKKIGIQIIKSTARDNQLLRLHNVRYLSLVRHLLDNPEIDKDLFQSYAQEIRARMYYDFLAENLLRLVGSEPDNWRLGEKVRGLVGESWLLSCQPPFSCYLADSLRSLAL